MTSRAIEDIYPLSPTQRGMLSHLLSEPGSRAYFEQFHCELRGDLDGTAFAAAWRSVIARHPVLRTAFDWEEADEPLQIVLREVPLPWVELDWRSLSKSESAERLEQFLHRDRELGFSLEEPPLMRLALIQWAEDGFYFVWSHHHLLLDGWCRPLLIQEVFTFYEAAARGRSLQLGRPRPFRDYIAWLQEQDSAAAEAFWRQQLRGYRGASLVSGAASGAGREERRGDDYERRQLTAAFSREMELFARRCGVTLSTVAQCAWALLFSRYEGSDDLAFGIVVSGRPPDLAGVESMVGLFINSLPLRLRIPWDRHLAAWLQEVQTQSLEIHHHGHVFLGDIRRASEVPPGRRLFDSLLAFQNFPADEGLRDRVGLEVRDSSTFELSEFPLSLVVEPGRQTGLWLGFDPRFVDRGMAARMLAQYEALLLDMLSASQRSLRDLRVLTESEHWQVLGEWNDTGGPPSGLRAVHRLIAERARADAGAVAVLAGGRRVSYGELLAQAFRVAQAVRALRLQPGGVIAVLMQRSPEHLAALLGVLQAGAAFLPLDPAYPEERLRGLLADSRAAALLTTQAYLWEHLAGPGLRIVDLDDLPPGGAGAEELGDDDDGGDDLESLAYVFYTSGSTGFPKGVAVAHRAFAWFAQEMAEHLGLGSRDRVLQFASPAFDVLLEEVFPVWLRGGAVVLEDPQTLSSPHRMAAAMVERGVTVAELPAAYWHAWVSEMEESGAAPPASLRLLIVGAEKPSPARLASWQRYGIPLIYVFGLTETAVTSSLHALAPHAAIAGELPIGRPLRGVRYYAADPWNDLAPIGAAGELYIGGVGLARGYWAQPEATAQRFVPDPWSGEPGARLYRTGDLVRHRPDGNLEFLGRADDQVKIRGFRIELGEIEAALRKHSAIAESVVAVWEEGAAERRLVAYVSPRPGYTPVGAGGVEGGMLLRERRLELWPSHGEYPLYDEILYHQMAQDEERNRRYRQAIQKLVAGKVVLDAGTGGEAVLARFCAEAGAARVYAVERSPAAFEAARSLVQRLGLADRIQVILGEATECVLPEPVDICVSELIGTIGGAEGAATILDRVRRRHLKPGGEMIPRRCVTRIAAVQIPDDLLERPRFGQLAAHYAEQVLRQIGEDGDLRVCVRKFPLGQLLSERGIFEELDFAGELSASYEREVRLRVTRPGRFDGFLVWIELEPEAGVAVSALEHECSWLPLLVPVFVEGEAVEPGDVIEARVGGTPSADGVHPDYRLAGRLRRGSGAAVEISYRSPYRAAMGEGSWFNRRLLAGYRRGDLAPEGETITYQGLRAHLAKVLPEYMLPSTYVALPALPLTPNGKVDRRALPAPSASAGAARAEADAPRNELEELLASIWREVLEVEKLGIHDNFFELGGDSILSIQVAARARKHKLELAPYQLFEQDTVAKLAALLAPQKASAPAPVAAAVAEAPSGRTILTPIQRWFFAQDLPEPWHWNMSVLLAPLARLSPDLLERGLEHLVERHEALRLRFRRERDEWTAEVDPANRRPALWRIDLSGLAGQLWERALEDASGQVQRSLDLGRAPLLAVAWFEVPGSSRLLLAAHHLVVDAVSWRILAEELATAHGQLLQGEAVDLAGEPLGFGAWSRRLADFARSDALAGEAGYWLAAPRRVVRPLPVDRPAGRNREASAQSVRVDFSAAETHRLIHVGPGGFAGQAQDLLLAALARALSEWTGQAGIVIDLEGHGREGLFPDADPSRTVGWFASVFPVLLELPERGDPLADLQAVRQQLRAVPGRGIGFGLLRYLGGDEVRAALAELPAAEVSFNYLGQIGGAAREGRLFRLCAGGIGPSASPLGRRGHLVEINAWIADGGLTVEWTFSQESHRRETVERLAADHAVELRSLLARLAAPGLRGRAAADFPLAAMDDASFARLADVLDGRGEIEDIYLQSPLQQGMMFHSLLEPGAGMYVAQLVCELSGPIDVACLVRSWQFTVDRQASLRAAFFWEELERPVQVVFRHAELPWTEVDLASLPAAVQERRLQEFLQADRQLGFEPRRAPLLRLCLFRLGPHQHRLVLTFHQMLLDGWSLPLVVEDTLTAYEAELRGVRAELPARPPYRDYIAWWLRQDESEAEAYWRRSLAGAQPTPTPRDEAPDAALSTGYVEERLHLVAGVLVKLQEYARRERLTLNTLLQASWGLLLGRYNAASEAILGVVVSGRPASLEGIESAIGLFVNTLPLRVPLAGGGRTADWLREVQRRQVEMRRYEHSPLAEVQRWAGVTPAQPLFESILVFQNYPVGAALATRQAAIGVHSARTHEQTHYGLTLVVEPLRELQMTVSYPCGVYRRATVERLLRQLQAALESLTDAGEVAGIGWLTEEERHQVLQEWNNERTTAAEEASLYDLFARHALARPDRLAAVYEDARLTFGGLLAASGRLGERLLALGVRPETAVGVYLERSLAPVVALLAVFRVGGVFVPLDPAQPRERLSLLLADCAASVLVTESSLLAELPPVKVPVLCIDRAERVETGKMSGEASAAPAGAPRPSAAQLAYVIFTSGSTGRPKGVAVEHRQLSHYVRAVLDRLGLPPGASFATVSSFATDLGHTAIFPALAGGGCLHVLAERRIGDPEAMAEYFARRPVDCLKIVPSHLAVLLSGTNPQAVLPRRCLVLGGEAADPGLVARLLELAPGCDVYNHYGPTEATVGVSTYRMPGEGTTAGSALPIGRPLPGLAVYVLASDLSAVPIAAIGELYIGGRGVARGYLGQAPATAERFIPDPWGERGTRLYRTGDLARRRTDGNVEFLGRADGQMKVRGYRVESSEVEGALRAVPGVREAAVVLREATAGDHRLVGYVVGQNSASPDSAALRAALRDRLPEYMVPSRFVLLDALPRLPSGKIDRRSLPAVEDWSSGAAAEAGFVAPRSPLEERLAEIWAQVLRVPRVGVHDDFFERFGGHSLLATQATSRIRRELQVDLPLRGIFDQPTVAGLAMMVAQQLASEAADDELERLLDELEQLPSISGSVDSGGAFLRPGS